LKGCWVKYEGQDDADEDDKNIGFEVEEAQLLQELVVAHTKVSLTS